MKKILIGSIGAAAVLVSAVSSCASAGATRDERSYQAGYHSNGVASARAGASPAAACRGALVAANVDLQMDPPGGNSSPYNAGDFTQGCLDAIHADSGM
jgi:hypothetical protein